MMISISSVNTPTHTITKICLNQSAQTNISTAAAIRGRSPCPAHSAAHLQSEMQTNISPDSPYDDDNHEWCQEPNANSQDKHIHWP